MEGNNVEFDNLMGTEGIPASILEAAKKIGQERSRWPAPNTRPCDACR